MAKTFKVTIGDDDVKTLQSIFENEASFAPQSAEDKLIIAILKQIVVAADQPE